MPVKFSGFRVLSARVSSLHCGSLLQSRRTSNYTTPLRLVNTLLSSEPLIRAHNLPLFAISEIKADELGTPWNILSGAEFISDTYFQRDSLKSETATPFCNYFAMDVRKVTERDTNNLEKRKSMERLVWFRGGALCRKWLDLTGEIPVSGHDTQDCLVYLLSKFIGGFKSNASTIKYSPVQVLLEDLEICQVCSTWGQVQFWKFQRDWKSIWWQSIFLVHRFRSSFSDLFHD